MPYRNRPVPVRRLFLSTALVLVAGAASADYSIQEVASGLSHPWSIAVLADGQYLVTSRDGHLYRLDDNNDERQRISGLPEVYVRSQAGLFDILPGPDFDTTGIVFLSYAHGSHRSNTLRVARAVLREDALTDLEVIFEGSPRQSTPVHYGGRLAWLDDGTLLITTGDGYNYREAAQRLDNTFGKTIRVHPDGSAPADNPFVADPDALDTIWTYGHRNAQGLVVMPDGRVFQHEHGPRGGDELNLLEPGLNYGWPVITHGVDYTGARITPHTEYPGMEQPLIDWTPSIAPSGMAWHDHDVPGWQSSLFVGGLAEQRIRQVRLVDGEAQDQGPVFPEIEARIRDIRTGPDGQLYVLTDHEDGQVFRITPSNR